MDGSAAPTDLRTQLRLGVVMTGGVSLAVWMGGVTLELDRLRREVPGSAYDELCRLAGVRPVVDIVSGTSAGGLNGTLLASATAWGSDVEDLRGVWLGAADMAALLRSPGAADPPSLLDGDGYFLGQTRQAIANVRTKGATPTGGRDGLPPVHLAVTSTLLHPNAVQFTDALGSPVSSSTYLGLYRFSTVASDSTDEGATFYRPAAVDQLARAARSSASFPGAFEASRIDTGRGAVDMAPVADFATSADLPATRYVLDGGLVANEPMDQVYELIRDQPSEGPVRRVLCYVSPLSGGDQGSEPPPFEDDPPDLLTVLTGTLLIPREQSIVRQLRTILERSDDQRAVSRARRTLTITAGTAPDLLKAAEALAPAIDRQRAEVALAAQVEAGGTPPTGDEAVAAEGRRQARRQALLVVQDLLRRAITRAAGDDLRALADERDAVSSALTAVLDGDDDAVRTVVTHAEQVLAAVVPPMVAGISATDAAYVPVERLQQDLAGLQALVAAAADDESNGDGAVWRAVRALDVLLTASSSSIAPNPQRIDLVQLSANAPNCFDGRTAADAKLTGIQLNHFGAFYRGGWRANDWMWGRLDGAMRIVELLVDPDALLATGTPIPELATRLHEIALGPEPSSDRAWLAQRPGLAGGVATIQALLDEAAAPNVADHKAVAARVRRRLARMVAARVQLQILRDELGLVRTSIAADLQAGAAATDRDGYFLEAAKQLDDGAPAATVVDVFRSCVVGLDRLGEEVGSDRMTRLSTQATAVGVGAVDTVAGAKGLDLVRPVLGTVRWTARLAHGLATSGFRGSQLARTAIPTAAVLAAALLALAVGEDRATALQVVLGVGLAGLSVVALLTGARSRGMVLAAVVAIVVLVGGLLLVTADWSAAPYVGSSLAVLAAAVLAALVLRRPATSAGAPAPAAASPPP